MDYVFGQNITEHNPAQSPSGHPLLGGPTSDVSARRNALRARRERVAAMLDAQKAALQNTIRQRLVAIREHRHL